jgi:hypothetical protein
MNELIPLSILELDLPAPGNGWAAGLAEHGIAIVLDDLGRASIPRAAARHLFEARRAAEAKARKISQRREEQAVEADRRWRASLPRGQRWWELPDGVHPATAMLQQAKDAEPKRRSLLEDAFAGTPSAMYVDEPRPAFEDEAL